jgi:heptosyltransferase-1
MSLMNKDIKRIAIVRLSALGDIVNSAVVLQFIKSTFASAKIEWITEGAFAPLLQNHPFIDKTHTINLKEFKKNKNLSSLKSMITYLRSIGDFDIVIDMQGLIKSAVVSRLISKNTHGFDKNSTRESLAALFYKTDSAIAYDENIVKRNCFVVSDALGFKISDEMLLNKQKVFKHTPYPHPKNGKKNVVIVFGASWESKKYPKEKIVELCDELQQNCMVIWGGEDEKKDALWICENSKYATLAPKLSLLELVSFIGSSDLLIGNDTGPTHMAWAQNIPSITLFGPTTTRMIYETPKNIGIKSPSKVDIFKIDKNDFSIKEIKVDEIVKKAWELLENGI